MINYIVAGQDRRVTLDVLQSIRSFTDAGCMVVGSQANRGLRWSSLCEQQATIAFDGSDDARFVDLVNDLTRYTRHLVLVPADCHAIRMVNRVAGRLQVAVAPVPDTPTMDLLDDHWRFQRLCRQQGLPVPASRLIGGEAEPDFNALASELGLPFVVKPVSHRDGGETVLVRCRRDLWRVPAQGLLVAQALPEGRQVSMSIISDRGQLTACALTGLDAEESLRWQGVLESLASRVCHAAAFNGPMRLTATVNARTGEVLMGDCVPHFWPGMTTSILAGLNLVAECVHPSPRKNGLQVVAGAPVSVPWPLAPSSWSRLAAPDEAGRLLRAMSLDLYSLSDATTRSLKTLVQELAHRPLPRLPGLERQAMKVQRRLPLS